MTRLSAMHGGINLAQGFPNFPAPPQVKDAAKRAIDADINQYAITWGSKSLRAALSGATPIFVPLRPPSFEFDADELARAFGPRTKAIIVNTPNNPTGRVFTRAELE